MPVESSLIRVARSRCRRLPGSTAMPENALSTQKKAGVASSTLRTRERSLTLVNKPDPTAIGEIEGDRQRKLFGQRGQGEARGQGKR